MQTQNEDRMPPLARSVPDEAAIKVVSDWIAGMLDPVSSDAAKTIAVKPKIYHPGLTASYNEGFVRKLVAEIRVGGDPNAGRQVDLSSIANGQACHRIDSDEPGHDAPSRSFEKGPNLSGVGSELSMESIVESILWPERTIKKGFELTALLLDNGRVTSGYVTSEDQRSITIRDFLTGNSSRFDRGTIEQQGDSEPPCRLTSSLSCG